MSLQSGDVKISKDGILQPLHAAQALSLQILTFKSSSGQTT
jgi:hypothetical protein